MSRTLLLLAACLLPACADAPDAPRPDVLLVVVDTLRADHVGAYGYERDTTPHLDALALEGVLFECAYAPMGTTTPSHAALFTARHPLDLGLVRNGLGLKDEAWTLAEALAERGYTTAAFVSSFPVSQRFNLQQGFAHFDDRFDAASSKTTAPHWEGLELETGFDRDAQATLEAAAAWLASTPVDGPLFLWLHLFDTHSPYTAPARWRRAFAPEGAEDPERLERLAANYDAAIRHTDELLERFLARYALHRDWEDTLLLFTADHGEGLGDHGWRMHNRFTYEEETRVPLLLRWPGQLPADTRCAQPAHLVDLMPTVLAALGAEAPAGLAGIDLLPHARGEAPVDAERALWLQRPFYAQGRERFGERGLGLGLRLGRWKYFEAPDEGRVELYDLERDPGERDNLAAERTDRVRELAARLAAWRAMQRGDLAIEDARAGDLEVLRAMGYAE